MDKEQKLYLIPEQVKNIITNILATKVTGTYKELEGIIRAMIDLPVYNGSEETAKPDQ